MQRYPFNFAILAKLGTMALSSCSENSEQNLIFDITCLGRFIGPRMSKYAQTSPKRVDYHVYLSGNKVIKAFTADDFVFFDKSGNTLELLDNSCLDQAHKVRITWRIQKTVRPSLYKPKRYATRYAMFALLKEWYSVQED